MIRAGAPDLPTRPREARVHWQNLIDFGVLPLTFVEPAEYEKLELGDVIEIADVPGALAAGPEIVASLRGG